MLYIFGDVHLSAMNPWNVDVGENFIKWFEEFCKETARKDITERNILWLGDITEKDVNPGDVIDQEYRIFKLCSDYFANTYVIMGNHDLKLYKKRAQHSLKFLRNLPNVKIIENPCDIKINETTVRMLPHLRVEGKSLSDYYSQLHFRTDADLVVGHWAKTDPNHPNWGGVDISNMRAKDFCLGHIHTRIEPYYTGSVFANKSTEAGERVYKVYNNGHEVQSVALPNFLEYRNVKYPEDPNTSVSSPYTTLVFDVENVVSVQQARVQYPNIYVRGTVKKKIDRELTESVKSSDVFLYKNNLQAYNDWLKETKYPIGRRASAMINELLK